MDSFLARCGGVEFGMFITTKQAVFVGLFEDWGCVSVARSSAGRAVGETLRAAGTVVRVCLGTCVMWEMWLVAGSRELGELGAELEYYKEHEIGG